MGTLVHAFSDAEYERRRSATLALAAQADAMSILAFGANRSGVHVTYLTGWSVTRAAWLRVDSSTARMWVSFHNHIPAARRMARVDDVGDIASVDPRLLVEGSGQRIATLGVVPEPVRRAAAEAHVTLVPLDKEHARLRSSKSEEEVAALRLGARASDIGAQALVAACRPGITDWELLAEARSAYTRVGARDHICYIGVTDMDAPHRDVPSQIPEGALLSGRSVVTFELSAAVAPEYPGQILRTVFLGEPTDEYVQLHAVANQAHDRMRSVVRSGVSARDLVESADCIEAAGFTTTDDLFHGLGMGYLDPIGVSPSRSAFAEPRGELRTGMSVVIQPNVTTVDHRAGVQTGQMIVVGDEGFEDLHQFPEGPVIAA